MRRLLLRSVLAGGLALGAPACGGDGGGPTLVGVWDASSFLVRLNGSPTEYTDVVTVVLDIEANTYEMRFSGSAVASGAYSVVGDDVTFENFLAAGIPMTLRFTLSGNTLTLHGDETIGADQIVIDASFDRR